MMNMNASVAADKGRHIAPWSVHWARSMRLFLVAAIVLCAASSALTYSRGPGKVQPPAKSQDSSTPQGSAQASAPTQPALTPTQAAQMEMFRELKPTLIIELTEANVNAYLLRHLDEFAIPEGFEDPRVTFSNGYAEASARTKVLFVATRVKVQMKPQIVNGFLSMPVTKVRAGVIPLPSAFVKNIAATITTVINQALEQNSMQLTRVDIVPGRVRGTAVVRP
jgi:hypothetical protein